MDTSRVIMSSGVPTRNSGERGYSGNDTWASYLVDPRNVIFAKNITPHTISVKDRWNDQGLDVTVAGFESVDLSGVDRQQLANSHSLKNAFRNGLLILVNEEQYWSDQRSQKVREAQAQADLQRRRQAEMIDVGSGRQISAEIIDGSSAARPAVADPRQNLKDPIKYAAMVQQAMQQGISPEQFADMVERQQVPMVQQAYGQQYPQQQFQQPQQFQPQPQYQQPQQFQPQPQQFQSQEQQAPMAMPPQYQTQEAFQQPFQQPMQSEVPMTVQSQVAAGPRPISPMGNQIQVPLGANPLHDANDPMSMTRTGGATVRTPNDAGGDATRLVRMGNFNQSGVLPGYEGGYAELPPSLMAQGQFAQPQPQQMQPQIVYPGQPVQQGPGYQPQPPYQQGPQPMYQPVAQAPVMYPQMQQAPMQQMQQGPLPTGQQEAWNAQQARMGNESFEVGPHEAMDDVAQTIAMIGGLPD